jgi:hypothetical protein
MSYFRNKTESKTSIFIWILYAMLIGGIFTTGFMTAKYTRTTKVDIILPANAKIISKTELDSLQVVYEVSVSDARYIIVRSFNGGIAIIPATSETLKVGDKVLIEHGGP